MDLDQASFAIVKESEYISYFKVKMSYSNLHNNQTHFGFQTIDTNTKSSLVGQVFSSVASKYDIMNDLMSVGMHRIWKNKMVEEIKFVPQESYKIIDVAGGTGDIALRILKKFEKDNANIAKKNNEENIKIEIVDINAKMLEVGEARAVDNKLFRGLNFNCQDGESLSYLDNSFDYYTIAFGIRNFTNIQNGLNEAFRVLKAGGKFICLEFSQVNNLAVAKIYDFYSFKAIPKIGNLVAKDQPSYQYLVESIRKFPNQDNFKKMIEKAGFSNVSFSSLNFGVVAIHIGWKY